MRKIYIGVFIVLNIIVANAQTINYTGSFTSFITSEFIPSTPQSITLQAYEFLGCTELEITAPIGFEVSTDGSIFNTFLTIPHVNDTVNTTLYVRLAAGNISQPNGVVDMKRCSAASGFTELPGNLNVTGTICTAAPPNAGPDLSVCVSDGFANVTSSGASGGANGLWQSSGTGTIVSPNTQSTDYYFSASDISSGFVNLTYQVSSPGCSPLSDDLILTINPSPTVSGGGTFQYCASTPFVNLNMSSSGSIHNWNLVSAAGILSNNTITNPMYTVSASDVSGGSAILEFVSSDGTCSDRDTVTLVFNADPVITAPANASVCSNDPSFNIIGTATGATTIIWSTSGSGTFGNANNLNTNYSFSGADIANGVVQLTLTGTNAIGCSANDVMQIVINSAPIANAGTDQTLCGNVQFVNLSGTNTLGPVTWNSLGSGTFNDNTSLTATYTPGPTEDANGYALLELVGANGGCLGRDTVQIILTPAPTVNAGADRQGCSSMAPISLIANIQNCTGVSWLSNGTGAYAPNSNSLSVTYQPSMNDTLQPFIYLSVFTTGNGICPSAADSVKVTYIQPGVVAAGADINLCGKEVAITSAIVSNGYPYYWKQLSGPAVSIEPDSNATDPYIVFASDSVVGNALITLNTLDGCNSVDTIIVSKSISGLPAADFTTTRLVTNQTAGISLPVNITGGTTVWQISGKGTIGGTNPYFYNPDAQDLADGYVEIVANTQGTSGCSSYYSSDTIYLVLANPSSLHAIQGTLDGSNYRCVLSKLLNDFWIPVIDTIFTTSNYSIPGLPNGSYKVQFFPDPSSPNKLPLYYGNSSDWETASIITINNANANGIDVTLPTLSIPVDTLTKYFGGVDKIIGRVTLNLLGAITNLRTTDATSNKPVAGATIVISNTSNSSKLSTTTTDQNGFYSVDNMNQANVNITVESPGTVLQGTSLTNSSQTQSVSTDGDAEPTQKDVSVVRIDDDSKNKLVNNNDPIHLRIGTVVYPNPAKGKTSLYVPELMKSENYTISILDASGKIVSIEDVTTNESVIELNLIGLNKGMYYLHVRSGRLQTTEKLIVE